MAFLQPLSTVTDLTALAFLLGVGAAALIYVPMLRRSRHRLAAQRARTHSLSRGPAAVRDPSALRNGSTSASATAVTVLAERRRAPMALPFGDSDAEGDGSSALAHSAEHEQANADLPTAPQPRIIDSATVPRIPTDLYQQHYEARFTRARRYAERVRSELGQ